MKKSLKISLKTLFKIFFIILLFIISIVLIIPNTTNNKNLVSNNISTNSNNLTNTYESSNTTFQVNSNDPLSETKLLLLEKFELAIDLYFLDSNYFNFSPYDSEKVIIENNVYYFQITNYDTILTQNISPNLFEDFKENAVCLVFLNDEPYIVEGGFGYKSYLGVSDISNINITNEKISCTITTMHEDPMTNIAFYKDQTFSIIKSSDSWLINEFDFLYTMR